MVGLKLQGKTETETNPQPADDSSFDEHRECIYTVPEDVVPCVTSNRRPAAPPQAHIHDLRTAFCASAHRFCSASMRTRSAGVDHSADSDGMSEGFIFLVARCFYPVSYYAIDTRTPEERALGLLPKVIDW